MASANGMKTLTIYASASDRFPFVGEWIEVDCADFIVERMEPIRDGDWVMDSIALRPARYIVTLREPAQFEKDKHLAEEQEFLASLK